MSTWLRLFVLTSSWLLGARVYVVAQDHPALTLTIVPTTYATPRSPNAVISLIGSKHFHVLLTNTSATPITLFEEWNSWGYFGLSFDITYADGHQVHMFKAARGWDKNFPSTLILAPNGFYVFDVNFDTTWANSIRLQPPSSQGIACRLRAVYSIAPIKTPLLDKEELSAWTGTVESAELPYTIWF